MGQAKRKKSAPGNTYGQPPEIVWHYTAGGFVKAIAEEGIRAITKEDGICWFSRSDKPDPTSSVMLTRANGIVSPEELRKEIFDIWRVGVSSALTLWLPDALQQWPTFRDNYARQLRETHGANVRDWYVSKELTIDQLSMFQKWTTDGWVCADPRLVDGALKPSNVLKLDVTEKFRTHLRILIDTGLVKLIPKPGLDDYTVIIDHRGLQERGLATEGVITLLGAAQREREKHGGPLIVDTESMDGRKVSFSALEAQELVQA